MTPKDYTTEDFINDDAFVNWVLQPDSKSDAHWRAFLLQYPHKHHEVDQARAFVHMMKFKDAELDDIAIVKLKSAIDLSILEDDRPSAKQDITPEQSVRFFNNTVLKIAASISIIAIAGLATWYSIGKKGDEHFANGIKLPENSEVVTSEKGKRSMLTLEDGTQVWLNADSHLAYSTDFTSGTTREVFLEGEAFFEVTENKDKPFIVNTGSLSVKVLGTAFNVKSFEKDATVETTLVHGKVQIETSVNDNNVFLFPNQQAVFVKQSGQVIVQNQIEAMEYVGWKSGKLYFKNETFGAIVRELERWYDVKIHLEGKQLLECSFSAKIDNKPLEEVLELFKATGPSLNYRIEGNEVFISGELCDE
jgi:ferric-dicitrate binding protein FerR (iron transport regulator)